MRSRIARSMLESKRSIPHFYIFRDVDCTALAAWRSEMNQAAQEPITWSDLIVKAVAAALEQFKRLNAHVKKDRIVLKRRVNIGLAVALDDGIVVPVIPDANVKSVFEIAASARQLVSEARSGVQKAASPATIPEVLFFQLFEHPLTEKGLEGFRRDWNTSKKVAGISQG